MKARDIIFRTGWLPCLIVLLLGACTEDDPSDSPEIIDRKEVTINIRVPGMPSPQAGRALTASAENRVDEVVVLVFQPGANGTFLYREDPVVQSGATDDQKKFTVTLQQGTVDLWILANCKDIVDSYNLVVGLSKTTIRENLFLDIDDAWDTSASGFTPFPMWGEKNNLTVAANGTINDNTPVVLIRAVAKLDVTIDRNTVPDAIFNLNSVRFYNWYNRSRIIPDASAVSPTDPSKIIAISGGAARTATSPYLEYTQPDADGFFTNSIYLTETPSGSPVGSGNPFLLIQGNYNGTAGWYKTEILETLNNADNYIPVLRNHHYKMKIISVSGRGYQSADEAALSTAQNITVDIFRHEDNPLSNVMWDGQYFLAWDPGSIEVDGNDRTVFITIESSCENGWRLNEISGTDVSWITISGADRTGVKNERKRIRVDIADLPTSDITRRANIHISAGRMDIRIPITQTNP